MPVYYISILRARQSFDPCAFALCSSSRLSPIPSLLFIAADMPQRFCSSFAACLAFTLFSALFCRCRYAATFLPALYRLPRLSPIPRLLFIAADMPQRFCSSFTFCSVFPLCPFRFLSPPCAEVRLFALRFVPPLIVAFSRARKRAGAFCCSRTDGESLRAKKPPR